MNFLNIKNIHVFREESKRLKLLEVKDLHNEKFIKSRSIKLVTVFIFLIFWIIFRILPVHHWKKKVIKTSCFRDYVQEVIFFKITIFLSQNLIYRDLLLIFSSSILDITLLSFFAIYVKCARSWRPMLTLFLFYAFRGAVVQKYFLFQFPSLYIFHFPDFYSFSVSYEITPDFFYSGHCGCSLILSYYLRAYGYYKFSYFGVFVCFMQIFSMLSLRGHYSIDLIFGFLFGHYFIIVSGNLTKYLDEYIDIFGYKRDIERKNDRIISSFKNLSSVINV